MRISRPHILMAMTNLIQNAIEAHAERVGFRVGKVSITVAHEENNVRIVVADTGGGLIRIGTEKNLNPEAHTQLSSKPLVLALFRNSTSIIAQMDSRGDSTTSRKGPMLSGWNTRPFISDTTQKRIPVKTASGRRKWTATHSKTALSWCNPPRCVFDGEVCLKGTFCIGRLLFAKAY